MWSVDLLYSILLWVSWAVLETWWLALAFKNCWKKYMQKTQFHICFLVRHMLEHYEPTYLYKVHWSATSSSLLLKRRVSTLALWRLSTTRQLMMESQTKENKKSSRTAKLWLQYIEYVDIIKQFFFVERISNWPLHLQTVIKMANLFAATGHINYARCTGLYVQEMMNLL